MRCRVGRSSASRWRGRLVNDPEVLLLDEPLGALDLQLRQQMQTELSRLHRATGATFIFVTHDQGEAMAMSGPAFAVMRGGGGSAGWFRRVDIYERPARRFVAEFIGHSNFFPWQGLPGRRALRWGGIVLPCAIGEGLRDGDDGRVLRCAMKRSCCCPGRGGVLGGTITLATYMGGGDQVRGCRCRGG